MQKDDILDCKIQQSAINDRKQKENSSKFVKLATQVQPNIISRQQRQKQPIKLRIKGPDNQVSNPTSNDQEIKVENLLSNEVKKLLGSYPQWTHTQMQRYLNCLKNFKGQFNLETKVPTKVYQLMQTEINKDFKMYRSDRDIRVHHERMIRSHKTMITQQRILKIDQKIVARKSKKAKIVRSTIQWTVSSQTVLKQSMKQLKRTWQICKNSVNKKQAKIKKSHQAIPELKQPFQQGLNNKAKQRIKILKSEQ